MPPCCRARPITDAILSYFARSSSLGTVLHQMIALAANVRLDRVHEIIRIGPRRGPQIDFRRGVARHDVRGLVADRRRCHAPDVERGILQRLLVVAAHGLGSRGADPLPEFGFVVGHFGQEPALRVGELHAVVIAGDGDAAIIVLHGGQQRGQPLRRVWRVVAEMAAVQRVLRAIDRELHQRVAPIAEHDGRPVAGMHGPVVDHDGIGSEKLAVGLRDDADRRRALLLLAVEQHLHVDGGRDARRLERIEGREEHHDRPLVVGRGAGKNPPVRVDLLAAAVAPARCPPIGRSRCDA